MVFPIFDFRILIADLSNSAGVSLIQYAVADPQIGNLKSAIKSLDCEILYTRPSQFSTLAVPAFYRYRIFHIIYEDSRPIPVYKSADAIALFADGFYAAVRDCRPDG